MKWLLLSLLFAVRLYGDLKVTRVQAAAMRDLEKALNASETNSANVETIKANLAVVRQHLRARADVLYDLEIFCAEKTDQERIRANEERENAVIYGTNQEKLKALMAGRYGPVPVSSAVVLGSATRYAGLKYELSPDQKVEKQILTRLGLWPGSIPVTPVAEPEKKKAAPSVDSKKVFEGLLSQTGESPRARFEVGLRYLAGDGVEKSEGTGWGYIRSAADAGYEPAVRKLEEREIVPEK